MRSRAAGSFYEVLHLIARQARALVGTGRCNLYLRDAESGLFRGQVTEVNPTTTTAFAG